MRIIYLQNTTAVPLRFCTYIIHINEHNNNNAPAVVNTYIYTYLYTHARIYTRYILHNITLYRRHRYRSNSYRKVYYNIIIYYIGV